MNKKLKIIALLLFALLTLSTCGKKPIEPMEVVESEDKHIKEIPEKSEEVIEEEDMIQIQLEEMNLEEKIGQLFIFGFDNNEIDKNIIDIIQKNHIGGFVFFKENIQSVEQGLYNLNSLKEINKNNPIPLFLVIDEEGGKVSRLPKPFLKMPTPKKIGDINDEKISLQYGQILGERVKSLGFNMDFAPVVDINSNPKNPVIGSRAFGSTVDIVVDNSINAMEGISSENIIPVLKHFPGHGDTKIDSHIDIPVIDKSMEELEELELIPFKTAIEAGADSIMIGHILFPKLDENNPATLSKNIINGILREKLSFDGVIISDDMTMGAIMENYNVEDAVVEFFKAGGDIALVCYERDIQSNLPQRIMDEVKHGNISEEEIDEKVYRILKLKEKYNISDEIISKANIEKVNQQTQEFLKRVENYK